MKTNSKFTNFLLCLLFSSALPLLSSCSSMEQGEHFKLGASLKIPRSSHSATLLKDGRVLIAGGHNLGDAGYPRGDVDRAEIYDPKSKTFKLTDTFKAKYEDIGFLMDAPLLPDGRVAFIQRQAQIFDPKTETFTLVGKMLQPRDSSYTITLLQNGKILITGGLLPARGFVLTNKSELFDPKTGTFTSTGTLKFKRFNHTAVLLKDGKVLILGGADGRGEGGCVNPPEIYDPKVGKFHLSHATPSCRSGYRPILLPNGNVLLHGGSSAIIGHVFESLPDEIYIPAQDKFMTMGKTVPLIGLPHVSLLSDGKILFTGGNNMGFGESAVLGTSELYDPQGGTYYAGPSLERKRAGFAQTILKDGTVFITGGSIGKSTIAVSEFYKGE